MDILHVVRRECVASNVTVADKAAIIHEIARLAATAPALAGTEERDIEEGLLEREEIGSTGFGNGIAIPHCRLESAGEFVVGVVSVSGGVGFESLDGEDVRLMVFIVGPARESNEHIRVLSTVSRVLSSADAVEEMVAARSDEALYESLARHLRDEPRAAAGEEKSLFLVVVQEEELFRQIL